MATKVRVQQGHPQRIVPARIERAVTGPPVLDAPDPDDRGWVNHRAAGLNISDARGALFGITVGDTVRLRLVRDDPDSTAPLFVSVTGNQVSIAGSAGPLPADGIFSVRGDSDTTQGSKIEVHIGTAGGPVICEADAHVFSPKVFNVTPHICTINQAAAGGTGVAPVIQNGAGIPFDEAAIIALFDDFIRPIWRPAGVQFNLGTARPEVYNGFRNDDVAMANETRAVFAQNRAAGTCNIYFVRFLEGALGIGLNFENRGVRGANNSGIMIGVEGSASNAAAHQTRSTTGTADVRQHLGNDIAHEIGHYLTPLVSGKVLYENL